jgi:hypothetical protein
VSREAPALELAERLKREYGVQTTAIQGVSGKLPFVRETGTWQDCCSGKAK